MARPRPYLFSSLNPRPTGGGGAIESTLPFFLISAKLMKLSTQNFQYLLGHQLYTLCVHTNFVPTIGWPKMDRHSLGSQPPSAGQGPWATNSLVIPLFPQIPLLKSRQA